MFLKNEAARLITINADGQKYQVLPGLNPAVEVPDAVAKIPFVQALLKNGSLRRAGEDELEADEGEDELEDLRVQAAGLGIKVDKRWKEERIREEVAKKSAE